MSAAQAKAKAVELQAMADLLRELADGLSGRATHDLLTALAMERAEWNLLRTTTPQPTRKRANRKVAK
jgi:hypothetical protein